MKPIGFEGETMRKRIVGGLILGMVAVGLTGACKRFRERLRRRHVRTDGQDRYQGAGRSRAKRSAVTFPTPSISTSPALLPPHLGRTEPIAGCMTSGCMTWPRSQEKAGESLDEDSNTAFFKAAYHKLCITCHKEIKVKTWPCREPEGTDKPLPKSGRLPARNATPNKLLPPRGRQQFILSD